LTIGVPRGTIASMIGTEASSALIERGDDLREAGGLVAAALGGRGSSLLVEGPDGIGKSTLISEVRERALIGGAAVLSARGAELERGFSFGVVRQLLEPALASVSAEEREALLWGAARLAEPAIGELDTELKSVPSSASPSLDPSFAVLHGLYWLTANLAERCPLLIAVDDAHWADAASLRFLVYLVGRLDQPSLTNAGHARCPRASDNAPLRADARRQSERSATCAPTRTLGRARDSTSPSTVSS
jgi:hypothetical protein